MDRVFSFLLWPKREARGPWKQGRKKRGSITCRTDRANKANKMFIIWLCRLFRFWKGDRELEVRTATYRPGIDQSQHAKSVSHIIRGINTSTFLPKNQKVFQLNPVWTGGPLSGPPHTFLVITLQRFAAEWWKYMTSPKSFWHIQPYTFQFVMDRFAEMVTTWLIDTFLIFYIFNS